MQKMVTAGCPGGPGGDPSCVHDPGGICLQRPRTAVDYCDVTQTRMGVQGRFLDASSLTRQSKYNLFRGVALRHLVSVRAVKRFYIRTHRFALFSPQQFWIKSPDQRQFEKIW